MADPQDKPNPRASRATIIAEFNDALRQNITSPGRNRVMITPAIVDLIGDTSLFRGFRRRAELLRAIRGFGGFEAGADPYGERDFGSFVFDEVTVFWKIDYYNATLDGGAENAADPQQSVRVLTIMLANEY